MSNHRDSSREQAHRGYPSSDRLWALLDAVPVAVVEWLDDGRTLLWNRAAEEIFGWPASEIVGRPCPLPARVIGEAAARFDAAVAAGAHAVDEELAFTRADGSVVEVSLCSGRVLADGIASIVITAVDIGERRRRSRHLLHLATHDPLTDLHNRRTFEPALERVLERVRRGGPPGAVLVVDVDLLKQLNDELGHPAGDALLIALAEVMRTAVRPRDLLARTGGDEFAVVLEGVTAQQTARIAERLRGSIAALGTGPGDARHSTASIGGVLINGSLDTQSLLAAADQALYRAKRRRDCVELSLGLDAPLPGELGRDPAVQRLRDAVNSRALAVQYQGVHHLSNGTIYCEEALARIKLDGTYATAGEFVELATSSGMIAEIDRQVLGLVLDRLGEPLPQRLSLNLSAASLDNSLLPELLRVRAPAPGYEQRLILEARESDLHADGRRLARWAQTLGELGAMIAADDFGIDRTSLAVLDSLPIGLVKLDPSIVASLGADSTRASVRQLTAECRDRGVAVVAKGIQDADTLRTLPELGVTLGQGFLLDAPHAVVSLADILETAEELGPVSLELVAWEFTVPELAVKPLWRHAIAHRLLAPRGIDPETGEEAFVITDLGRERRRTLRDD